jgi:hypothetical protein
MHHVEDDKDEEKQSGESTNRYGEGECEQNGDTTWNI